MARLITAVLVTVALVTFSVINTHHVPLYLLGASVKVRLIFLLMTAFLCGAGFVFFVVLIRAVQRKRHAKIRLPTKRAVVDSGNVNARQDQEEQLCG